MIFRALRSWTLRSLCSLGATCELSFLAAMQCYPTHLNEVKHLSVKLPTLLLPDCMVNPRRQCLEPLVKVDSLIDHDELGIYLQ